MGSKMAGMSGLRSIMEDVANATAGSDPAQWMNLSIGNPAAIPAVTATWRRLTEQALAENFEDASCSYGPSRGLPALVEAIVDYFNERYGWHLSDKNVVVGPGSQMLCFIAAALFAGPEASHHRRVVLPITPDYTGYQGLCMNADGMIGVGPTVELGDDRYFNYAIDVNEVELQDDVGMMLVSSPCNPTGRCVTSGEFDALVGISELRNVPLVIDHAYGEPFRITKVLVPPTFNPVTINCFSLSKAGLPGERIGFAVGPERYIAPMVSFVANSICTPLGLRRWQWQKASSPAKLDAAGFIGDLAFLQSAQEPRGDIAPGSAARRH